ncbi:O-antigen ligase family protein [Leptospira vanthielii]|uniref:O-antigen ligase domain-containing protein n=1 Tax=Leptospira vanthielii TaxID=293085 RepID=A0ABY2NPS1_9LEPT|nr:O-antigen ligase family protein [Leptospira vanthielii]TGM56780.1 O-antigen ligase domain-containing protein [Leptospira vanthielii]
MIGKETFHKISVVFLYLFFALSPFSISLSQIFAGTSLFFLFLDSAWQKNLPRFESHFLFWLLLYLSFLITPVLHWDVVDWKRILMKSEFGDIWMGFLLLHHSRLTWNQKKILKRAVEIGAVFLILSGIISLLFPYRLAPFVMDGFQYLTGRRLPHQLANVMGKFPLYLPIGFQSTHLTYGGLLALYLPSIFVRTLRNFNIFRKKARHKLSLIYLLGFSFLGLVLLFLNQSRSVWFGLLFGFILLSLQKKVSIKKILPWIGFGLLGILFLSFLLYQYNWLFQRAIDDIFAKRSLENQRVWIHKMNFGILKDSFFGGIGSGNYPSEFISKAIPLVKEWPELYYDLSITPKSHAHFDFLHFWILGGLVSVISFFGFLYLTTKNILTVNKHTFFYLGFFTIIFAGSFQCFLLDDEVLLPFLGILCLLPKSKPKSDDLEKRQIRKIQNKVYGLLLFWILISSIGAFYLTKTPAKELFIHRVRTETNSPFPLAQSSINANGPVALPSGTKELYFKLSGCLDHKINFDTDAQVRENPIQIKIHWEGTIEGDLPDSLVLETRKRESFDQDKEYRVQSERIVKKETILNDRKIVSILVNPKAYLGSGVEFIDFGFLYSWKGENPFLPAIEISGNCD